MNRNVRLIIGAVAMAAALFTAMPTSARVEPAADLQIVAGGSASLAAAPLKCKRQRDRCPISNASGCDC